MTKGERLRLVLTKYQETVVARGSIEWRTDEGRPTFLDDRLVTTNAMKNRLHSVLDEPTIVALIQLMTTIQEERKKTNGISLWDQIRLADAMAYFDEEVTDE